MKAGTARRLMVRNINGLSFEELQKHKIRLLDAWRESTGEYWGIPQAVRDGYMIRVLCDEPDGPVYVPKDLWLSVNLRSAYDRACEQEKLLLQYPTWKTRV